MRLFGFVLILAMFGCDDTEGSTQIHQTRAVLRAVSGTCPVDPSGNPRVSIPGIPAGAIVQVFQCADDMSDCAPDPRWLLEVDTVVSLCDARPNIEVRYLTIE